MLSSGVKPYANSIWNWNKTQQGANLINIDYKTLMLTLLPRTEGKFSRFGLKVNKLRYTNDGYTEQFLKGGTVTVSYNPDDVSKVWVIEKGIYVEFELIETQFKDNTLDEIEDMRIRQNDIENYCRERHSEINELQEKLNVVMARNQIEKLNRNYMTEIYEHISKIDGKLVEYDDTFTRMAVTNVKILSEDKIEVTLYGSVILTVNI